MNFYLDIKTVFVLLALGQLLPVIPFSAYRNKSAKDPAIDAFFASKWFQAVVWGIFVFSENVYKSSDEALYQAKKAGRDRTARSRA